MAREDWPLAFSCPRYCETASRALRPAYQARSAARESALGKPSPAAWDWTLFTLAILAVRSSYCDKKDYLDSTIILRCLVLTHRLSEACLRIDSWPALSNSATKASKRRQADLGQNSHVLRTIAAAPVRTRMGVLSVRVAVVRLDAQLLFCASRSIRTGAGHLSTGAIQLRLDVSMNSAWTRRSHVRCRDFDDIAAQGAVVAEALARLNR